MITERLIVPFKGFKTDFDVIPLSVIRSGTCLGNKTLSLLTLFVLINGLDGRVFLSVIHATEMEIKLSQRIVDSLISPAFRIVAKRCAGIVINHTCCSHWHGNVVAESLIIFDSPGNDEANFFLSAMHDVINTARNTTPTLPRPFFIQRLPANA